MPRLPLGPQSLPGSPNPEIAFNSPTRLSIGAAGSVLSSITAYEQLRRNDQIRTTKAKAEITLESSLAAFTDQAAKNPDNRELVSDFDNQFAETVESLTETIPSRSGQDSFRGQASGLVAIARSRFRAEEIKRERAHANAILPERIDSAIKTAADLELPRESLRDKLAIIADDAVATQALNVDEREDLQLQGMRQFDAMRANKMLEDGAHVELGRLLDAGGFPDLSAAQLKAARSGIRAGGQKDTFSEIGQLITQGDLMRARAEIAASSRLLGKPNRITLEEKVLISQRSEAFSEFMEIVTRDAGNHSLIDRKTPDPLQLGAIYIAENEEMLGDELSDKMQAILNERGRSARIQLAKQTGASLKAKLSENKDALNFAMAEIKAKLARGLPIDEVDIENVNNMENLIHVLADDGNLTRGDAATLLNTWSGVADDIFDDFAITARMTQLDGGKGPSFDPNDTKLDVPARDRLYQQRLAGATTEIEQQKALIDTVRQFPGMPTGTESELRGALHSTDPGQAVAGAQLVNQLMRVNPTGRGFLRKQLGEDTTDLAEQIQNELVGVGAGANRQASNTQVMEAVNQKRDSRFTKEEKTAKAKAALAIGLRDMPAKDDTSELAEELRKSPHDEGAWLRDHIRPFIKRLEPGLFGADEHIKGLDGSDREALTDYFDDTFIVDADFQASESRRSVRRALRERMRVAMEDIGLSPELAAKRAVMDVLGSGRYQLKRELGSISQHVLEGWNRPQDHAFANTGETLSGARIEWELTHAVFDPIMAQLSDPDSPIIKLMEEYGSNFQDLNPSDEKTAMLMEAHWDQTVRPNEGMIANAGEFMRGKPFEDMAKQGALWFLGGPADLNDPTARKIYGALAEYAVMTASIPEAVATKILMKGFPLLSMGREDSLLEIAKRRSDGIAEGVNAWGQSYYRPPVRIMPHQDFIGVETKVPMVQLEVNVGTAASPVWATWNERHMTPDGNLVASNRPQAFPFAASYDGLDGKKRYLSPTFQQMEARDSREGVLKEMERSGFLDPHHLGDITPPFGAIRDLKNNVDLDAITRSRVRSIPEPMVNLLKQDRSLRRHVAMAMIEAISPGAFSSVGIAQDQIPFMGPLSSKPRLAGRQTYPEGDPVGEAVKDQIASLERVLKVGDFTPAVSDSVVLDERFKASEAKRVERARQKMERTRQQIEPIDDMLRLMRELP